MAPWPWPEEGPAACQPPVLPTPWPNSPGACWFGAYGPGPYWACPYGPAFPVAC